MRPDRVVASALALSLLAPLTAVHAQEQFPDPEAPETAPARPAPAPEDASPTPANLPPVQVHLSAFGAPSRVTVALSGAAHAYDAATGEELPLEGGSASLSALGKQVRLGEKQAGVIRLEADQLTLGEGRSARAYPTRLLISAPNGRLKLVNECSLEDYTQGVLSGECPASFHPEAIKAMAIAVRSYSYRKAFIAHAELCDSTHCQVYRGLGGVRSSIREAVRATAGTVALYDGAVIDAVYSSDCGGCTEGNEDAWKGARPIPYLRPVVDAPEPHATPYCAVNRSHTWSFTVPLSRLGGLVGKFAPGWKLNLQDFTASGRVRTLGLGPAPKDEAAPTTETPRCGDTAPDEAPKRAEKSPAAPFSALRTFTGEQWRRMFGLSTVKSLMFAVRTTDRGVEIDGKGWGHGVGLCQFGAHGMALKGALCEEILKHYYTGVSLSVAPPPPAATAGTPAPTPRRRMSRRFSLPVRRPS